jgi:L-ascorbate metabolism protein UlaG (beta-lactamase superfamily)
MRAGRILLLTVALATGCAPVPVPLRSAYHPSDADLGVTRIAHGAVLLEMKGTRVVVDPWFHSGFWNRQSEPLGLTPDTLPALAAVLVTHGHGQHFDERALRELARTVPVAVARPELAGRLGQLGFKEVTPLDWWDTTRIGPITVTAVPARHSVPENGYVLDADGVRAYAAGDTRPYPELVDVATRFPKLDVALLPVGGERVLGFERSMGPRDAAEAAALLSPHRVIPIVYGARGLPRCAGTPAVRWSVSSPSARSAASAAIASSSCRRARAGTTTAETRG